MPIVSTATFVGIKGQDYHEFVIRKKNVKDEWKLKDALNVIFDGDGTPREYACCQVNLEDYCITSWEKKDVLSELSGMEDTGVVLK